MKFNRITIDPYKMGGAPCIRGLRIPVATVVGMVADGMNFKEILEAYPDLWLNDIKASLQYAGDNNFMNEIINSVTAHETTAS